MDQYKNFVITLTFSTQGENHIGNQKLGKMKDGFDSKVFENNRKEMQIFNLGDNVVGASDLGAYLALVPDFCLQYEKEIRNELISLYWDRHMWSSRKTVVQNKQARANTLFAYKDLDKKFSKPIVPDIIGDKKKIDELRKIPDNEKKEQKEEREKNLEKRELGLQATMGALSHIQDLKIENYLLQYPDYDIKGMGCVYDIEKLPNLDKLCKEVIKFCKSIGYEFSSDAFIVEGNFYYDINDTYIGFHGDAERKAVFGVRLGPCDFPLYYGWWKNLNYITGSMKSFNVKSGSAYIMSEKAAGTDWLKKANNLMTLRHAAGNLFTLLKESGFKGIIEKDNDFLDRVCTKKEISFPLGDADLILSKFLSIFVEQKPTTRVEVNWLKKYQLMKAKNDKQ